MYTVNTCKTNFLQDFICAVIHYTGKLVVLAKFRSPQRTPKLDLGPVICTTIGNNMMPHDDAINTAFCKNMHEFAFCTIDLILQSVQCIGSCTSTCT